MTEVPAKEKTERREHLQEFGEDNVTISLLFKVYACGRVFVKVRGENERGDRTDELKVFRQAISIDKNNMDTFIFVSE